MSSGAPQFAGRPDEQRLAKRVTTLINRLGRTLHCLQFSEGLNPAQWEALRYLRRANRYSRTPSALADYLGTTKGTVSQTIKALETKGLVERVPHDRDGRAVLLKPTAAGETVLNRDPLKCIEKTACELGLELEAAHTFLDGLIGGLQPKSCSAGFGVCEECQMFRRDALGDVEGGPHRCGLTGDPLSGTDSQKICVNHRS